MVATIGSLFSDQALREYAIWAGGLGPGGSGVLKYSYDASRHSSKMQSVPLRTAHAWPLRPALSSKFQSLPIRTAHSWPLRPAAYDWVLRGRAQQGEELLLAEPVAWPVLLVGVLIGWIIKNSWK